MEIEKYFIFEFAGTDQKLFFSPEEFINQGLKISRLTLLHLHCPDNDYYLFFGKNGYDNFVEFSFQFNIGDEFTDFLINNGASYHRHDVIEIIDSGAFPKFKLKDDSIIQYETYANGTTKGLNVYNISGEYHKQKVLLGLPIAKLKLYNTDVNLTLKWSGETVNGKIPATFNNIFNDVVAQQKKINRRNFYYLTAFIVLIALVIYYFYFM